METPNLNYIKELSGGDNAFEESILEVLKKEFPEELKLFKEILRCKAKLIKELVQKTE